MSHTVCECDRLGHYALLLEEHTAPLVIQLPAFHVEIIIGAVLAVLVLVTVLIALKVAYPKLLDNVYSIFSTANPWLPCNESLTLILSQFQFRTQVHKFVFKSPCFKEEKKGLENCHKSQSFFNGINLMPTSGAEKSQTLSTNVPDSQSKVRVGNIFKLISSSLRRSPTINL